MPPAPLLIVGNVNLETTLRVEGFPVPYQPLRFPFFGIGSSVSGVGFNLAKALHGLGQPLRLLSVVGDDLAAGQARAALRAAGLSDEGLLPLVGETAQSVILYDGEGQRAIHADLKDVQQARLPSERVAAALEGCGMALLCNINYARPLLAEALARGLPIATDVHTIAALDDPYNGDFMAAATILFQSHERLPVPPEQWAAQVMARYSSEIVVVGLGAEGALLAVRRDRFVGHFPAVATRPLVNSIGAGDALFAAFVDGWRRTGDPYAALRRALYFASWKMGERGAAAGFLSAAALEALVARG